LTTLDSKTQPKRLIQICPWFPGPTRSTLGLEIDRPGGRPVSEFRIHFAVATNLQNGLGHVAAETAGGNALRLIIADRKRLSRIFAVRRNASSTQNGPQSAAKFRRTRELVGNDSSNSHLPTRSEGERVEQVQTKPSPGSEPLLADLTPPPGPTTATLVVSGSSSTSAVARTIVAFGWPSPTRDQTTRRRAIGLDRLARRQPI